MSYDCEIPLETLCATLNKEGFSFVAVSDHTRGVSAAQFREFVSACVDTSSVYFVVVPGLEVKLDNGDEIVAVGITEFISATSAQEVIEQIHLQGGYAIWPHPRKQKQADLAVTNCDAIEVLNGKMDGMLAPNLSLYWQIKKLQRSGIKLHQIFGADLHNFEEQRSVWTECEVNELSVKAVLKSLHEGRYINRVARVMIPSNGKLSIIALGELALFRVAYHVWNWMLDILPAKLHRQLVGATRSLVEFIKGCNNK
jgi:hypothetical protein